MEKNKNTVTEMKDTFRYFLRKNFAGAAEGMKNKDIDELGVDFHSHLDEKLTDEQKEKILPKDVMNIIVNSDHPLKVNGFEPAYHLHFIEWISKQVKSVKQ